MSAFFGCSKQRERVLALGPWVTWAQGRSKQALERLPGSVLAFSLTNTSLGFKGEAPRGSGGCGGVRGVHGSLYISLVTSLPARCWVQGGVEGCLHISLLETAGTQQQDDQTSWGAQLGSDAITDCHPLACTFDFQYLRSRDDGKYSSLVGI